jgi:sugar phosphate isomerase/epimerase
MQDNIYVSTSAFKEKELGMILDFCLGNNLTNIELGANLEQTEMDIKRLVKLSKEGMRFLIHNYFPRPKEDFVLNLASDDKAILTQSLDHCRRALELSAQLQAPFYSVHAGFAFHASPADLGQPQIDLPRIPYQIAYDNFVRSISELARFAAECQVKLAVENNVLAGFNVVNGKNEICLLAEAGETLNFNKEVASDNLFYLIDLGHLKVTANSLKFSAEDYLRKILPHALAFHLSENNRVVDSHSSFDEKVWFGKFIKGNLDKTLILEICNVRLEQLKSTIAAIERVVG